MTSRIAALDATARDVVAGVLARPSTLGARGRLVCVDGPAGAGKTTVAAALNRELRDVLRPSGSPASTTHVRLLHMDNLYAGWGGLAEGRRTMAERVVAPLRHDETGEYERYDWHRGRFAETRRVDPVDVLVIEGVGSANPVYRDVTTCTVWVDAPPAVRLERALLRDGGQVRAKLLDWQVRETALFDREDTAAYADVVIDGTRGVFAR